MWTTRDETQNAVHSVFIILEHWYTLLHVGISCKKGEDQQFINYTMDLLSVPEYVIKKGRPHEYRYGKKPGDKEYFTANQLKKTYKKKFFQGIHDRFIRDPEYRSRIIENHRDEELCRRWDALADEYHTHHLTTQEYSLYQSKLWLHSNKQGSNSIRLTQRLDFKLATRSRRRPQVPTYSNTSQQWAQSSSSSSWWNWQGSWWTPYSYESHDGDEPRTDRTGWPVEQYLERFFWATLSWIQLLCFRWIVYSWQRSIVTDGRCKHNTSKDPFSRCKSVQLMATGKNWRSQHTVWLQIQKWTKSENSILVCYACVVVLHDYTTDTKDDMTAMTVFLTKHINTNPWVRLVLFILCQRIVTLHTAPHGSSPSHVRHSFHPHALMMCAVLPRHWSFHSLHHLPLAPPVALLPPNLCTPPKKSISIRSGEDGGCSQNAQNSKVRVSRYMVHDVKSKKSW